MTGPLSMGGQSSPESVEKSALSDTARKVMPYMEHATEILRRRDVVSLANKLVRQALLNEVINPKEKADFQEVMEAIRTQMMEEYTDDEEGRTIISNYLDGIKDAAK
ncbi:MAG: hypothetical protein Q8P62_01100 [Candidatus Peregrinibacteria bacterium]|nr:hypothetical protein [Candidatus Peregrinibacteria bacterium]